MTKNWLGRALAAAAVLLWSALPAYAQSASVLEFPATGSWNGHLKHYVVLECASYALVPVNLRLTMFDADGSQLGTRDFTVPSLGVYHNVLNDFAIVDAYGTFELELLTSAGDGRMACVVSTYRLNSSGQTPVDYAYAIRIDNPFTGNRSGVYNSNNPEGGTLPVFNYLSIVNPDPSSFSAEVDVFDGSGSLIRTVPVTVAAKGRVDIALGHNETINGGQLYGLYQIRPSNASAPYIAHLARYLQPGVDDVRFAFTLLPKTGACGDEPVFLSTMNPALNWLEVANSGGSDEEVTISVYDQLSALLHQETRTIASLSQYHLNINQFLGDSNIGYARISCSSGTSTPLIVQSSHYGRLDSASSKIVWAYASQKGDVQAAPGERLVNFVNTFLGMDNWMKMAGGASGDYFSYMDVFSDAGARVDKDYYTVNTSLIYDVGLHMRFDADRVGQAVLRPARSGGPVVAELLRVFHHSSAPIGSIMRVPAAVVRADDLRVSMSLLTGDVVKPTYVGNAGDGSGRIFIVEREGRIRIHDGMNLYPTPFLDISSQVGGELEQGFHSIAFHPNFAANDRVFVSYSNLDGDSVVSEFAVQGSNPDQLDPSSERIIMTVEQPAGNHNGGQLQFGPDGYLYFSLGDGGFSNDFFQNGQNLETLLASILRIDVDGAQPYEVPPDNPFVGVSGARPEIWAYGFRNPWKFSFDMVTERMFVADVGQGLWEELDIVSGGGNYGWNVMEGLHCFQPAVGCDMADLELPVFEYSHDDGTAIIGGVVYRGSAIPNLVGAYVFVDFSSGKIWALQESSAGTWIRQTIYEGSFLATTIGEDEDGEMYLGDHLGNVFALHGLL
ncbi:MAG: PQQ-dependent sugar dehydrogenase [Bdellovibrionales bacterium]|nr:PQQ-dependent sugar dehydrogenase [Bdellovibrionales bacterium]